MILRYFTGGLAFVALMLGIALSLERGKVAKRDAQIASLQAELTRISTARDEQRETTERTIKGARDRIDAVQPVKHKLETAPVPSDCRTPGLDTAREVL